MAVKEIFDWAERAPERTAAIHNGQVISYRMFAHSIALGRAYFARLGWIGAGFAAVAIHDLMDAWITIMALRSLGLTTIVIRSPAAVGALALPGLRGAVTSAAETWPDLARSCADHGVELLSVALGDETPLPLGTGPDHPWGGHILETSGTTGVAKKVLMDATFEDEYLRRRRELNGIDHRTIAAIFNFHTGTGVGYKAPINVWIVGGTVVLQDSGDLRETLRIPDLTHASMVPSMLLGVLATPPGSFPRQPAMKLAITGGTITQGQIDEAKARITPQLINGLGATESHSIALTDLNTPDDHRWHRLVPTSDVEIVDDDGKPVSVGEIGRLRVGTAGGPTGYLFDEAATRTFFKDGFFYTGDLALTRADGRIALQGRVSDVINMFGHKINPAPIEERLCEALGICGLCLFSMQDENGEEGLHAIIESPEVIDTQRLVDAFSVESLGRVHVYFVTGLPRNAMGKLMRQEAKAFVLRSL